jgi:putative phosphoribosyl transferase
VGYEVAAALEAPLDIIVVRKLGTPDRPELAMGAIIGGKKPEMVLNREIVRSLRVTDDQLDQVVKMESEEVGRREQLYRRGRDPLPLDGCTGIVVDDGIATGASIRAAICGLRRRPLARLIVAVPVAPEAALHALRPEVDELVCLEMPRVFGAVGEFYDDFCQTDDATVITLLEQARRWTRHPMSENKP